jgi:hypothetical protein
MDLKPWAQVVAYMQLPSIIDSVGCQLFTV